MSSNSTYAQQSLLVTLKWREIVSIGRATALWALLCLSETPPADPLRATWLLQAIASAQNLQPSDLVRYLDQLNFVVQNFEFVWGIFPLAFGRLILPPLVLTTSEKSVCPRCYPWGALAETKYDFRTILNNLLRHLRGLVADTRVRFVQFDAGSEFVIEDALPVSRAWQRDYSINCPTHHWQTGPVEQGHSKHQDSKRSMGLFAIHPSDLLGHNFLLSVEGHNLQLHTGADVFPYFDLTGLGPDSQLSFIWRRIAVLHNHSVNYAKFNPHGLSCIYLGTGYFAGVHGAKFLNPTTGKKLLFSIYMTVSEHFLPFKELVSNPWAVLECFGLLGFWNLVAWILVDTCVRKCFNGTWYIGTIVSYNLQQQWFAVKYCDGTEEYSLSAFFLAVPVMAAAHVGSLCSHLPVLSGNVFVSGSLFSLLEQVAYSVDARDRLGPDLACVIHVKPAVHRNVVLNPIFPLKRESIPIPTTYRQAQQQPCAPYWNVEKELCLARHHELHVHDDGASPSPSVQVLDTKWVFDLNIMSTTRKIARFKTRIVAHGQPQILGFDCYDVHAPTIGFSSGHSSSCSAVDSVQQYSHSDLSIFLILLPLMIWNM